MNYLSQTVPIQFDTCFSPYKAADWREAFRDLHEKGMTGVEIAVAYPDRVDAQELLTEANKNGLKVTSISTGQIYGLEGLFLTSPDAAVRDRAREVVENHILLAQRLGGANVTIGLIRGKLEPGGKNALSWLLRETLTPLCHFAAKHGIKLQMEAINHGEASFINSTRDCVNFIAGMGSPQSLGILFDTFHSNIEDEDVVKAAKLAVDSGRLMNIHFADSHRGLPGEGSIDFPAVVRVIRDGGYTGAFTLETLCVPSEEHVLNNYADALKRVTA